MNKKYVATLLLLCSHAFAADPVLIFGLPLGGIWDQKPKICPWDTDKATSFCWIGKPFVAKDGTRLGSIHFPKKELLPKWAAYSLIEIHLSKTGVIDQIGVNTLNSDEKNIIAQSISARFGLPKNSSLNRTDLALADWSSQGAHIHMMCVDKCMVGFRSSDAQKKHEKYIAESLKKEAARPVAP